MRYTCFPWKQKKSLVNFRRNWNKKVEFEKLFVHACQQCVSLLEIQQNNAMEMMWMTYTEKCNIVSQNKLKSAVPWRKSFVFYHLKFSYLWENPTFYFDELLSKIHPFTHSRVDVYISINKELKILEVPLHIINYFYLPILHHFEINLKYDGIFHNNCQDFEETNH